MKKLINRVDDVLSESLRGFGAAHGDLVEVSFEPRFVARKGGATLGKVALISGGGSGHEPMHAGFVGRGMLDAACPGEVFTSPTPDQMLAAAEAVDGGAGVLWIVKNYAGDVMNFEMAAEMFAETGGDSATVLTNDDVAVETSLHSQGRRGVAATVIVEKMVGAAAERGDDLAACKALGDRINAASGTVGVALDQLHRPRRGQADLHPRRGRDRDGRRHPRRARPPARGAAPRRRHRRRADRGDRRRPAASGRARRCCWWSMAWVARHCSSSTSSSTPRSATAPPAA